MLNILELFDVETRTGLNIHRSVEIMKFGAAARCDLSALSVLLCS